MRFPLMLVVFLCMSILVASQAKAHDGPVRATIQIGKVAIDVTITVVDDTLLQIRPTVKAVISNSKKTVKNIVKRTQRGVRCIGVRIQRRPLIRSVFCG